MNVYYFFKRALTVEKKIITKKKLIKKNILKKLVGYIKFYFNEIYILKKKKFTIMSYSICGYSGSSHSGSDSSDSEASEPRNTISNIMYKLEKLNFTHDFGDSNLKEVDVMHFNPWKLTVR